VIKPALKSDKKSLLKYSDTLFLVTIKNVDKPSLKIYLR
jgi:hypothetical protein